MSETPDVAAPTEIDTQGVRTELLEELRESIDRIEYKLNGDGRIRDPERFELELKGHHKKGYLTKIALDLLNDIEDTAEFEERLRAVEEQHGMAPA